MSGLLLCLLVAAGAVGPAGALPAGVLGHPGVRVVAAGPVPPAVDRGATRPAGFRAPAGPVR